MDNFFDILNNSAAKLTTENQNLQYEVTKNKNINTILVITVIVFLGITTFIIVKSVQDGKGEKKEVKKSK